MKKRFDSIDARLDTIQNMCETVIQQTANPSTQDFDIEFNPITSRPTRYAPDTTQQTSQLSSTVNRSEFDSALGKVDQLHNNFDSINKQLQTLNSMFGNTEQ